MAFVLRLFVAIAHLASPFAYASLVDQTSYSRNVSSCPGYMLDSLRETNTGLTAQLTLTGQACNAFGIDIPSLTIQVDYETETRLHVNIFDTDNRQYTIPQSVIARPDPPTTDFTSSSDLVFNYDAKPFAFWITRRSQPDAVPLFDTRLSSLPKTPIGPVLSSDKSTALDGFPLVFEDQYLQLTSALPLDANIYGLGEVVSSSGFRRNVGPHGGTIQTMWARDVHDPVDENLYGSHPLYLEHRLDPRTGNPQSHGVFLLSAAGGDILLLTPQSSKASLVQYRMIGGVLDFYFFSGPSPISVIEQYGQLIGLPTWQPAWGFGFHLCRWGYTNIIETREQVVKMREANIPLEVMWNDIDLYHAFRDFTSDPVSFPGSAVRAFIEELASNHQHYIPIVDAAIAKQVNATDIYEPYIQGIADDVFIKNPDGSEYVGQVWPGYTVFPDWFQKNTQEWWTNGLRKWSESGVTFSGIWLDMNEASSFCDGSCGSGKGIFDTRMLFVPPREPGNLVVNYPNCNDAQLSVSSGHMTVNGRNTCRREASTVVGKWTSEEKRGLGAGHETDVNVNDPPYAIHNGFGRLSVHTIATNAVHVDGVVELDVHNLWGLMEERATHMSLLDIIPGKRPFVISRSTFPSSGRWTGHWLGDNHSLWSYLRYSLQGILQFQLFQIPFVGADTCGFNGNTDEELCNRWMQLSAFTPFYRNHNIRGAIPQEPYRWNSVASASRTAIAIRYALLPYWYTLFANSSTRGTPPVRALFFEFPEESELFAVDSQFMIGRDILVTPVLDPSVTSVQGIFPGRGKTIWRDWYTHEVVTAASGGPTTLSAPLGHINVHVRDGAAILLHAAPSYTIEETRNGPFALLVSLSPDGEAFGTAYVDDGISSPPGPSRVLTFTSEGGGQLVITGSGPFHIEQTMKKITVMGVQTAPKTVLVDKKVVGNWSYNVGVRELVVDDLSADLNVESVVEWS